MATYPASPVLSQGTDGTEVNPVNWNTFVDNINAIGADLVASRGDGQTFPGTPYSSGQSTNLDDALQALRHMVSLVSGETNWFDAPSGSLADHDHSVGEGGSIGWDVIGTGTCKKLFYPEFSGAIRTDSLRGASASGNNSLTFTVDQEVVSDVSYNFYEATSSEVTRQDTFVSLILELPEQFDSWASSNALRVTYRTESATWTNCHVDLYVYKGGSAGQIHSDEQNSSLTWTTIDVDSSDLGTWSAGDQLELYFKLETSSNYFARLAQVELNYVS